MRTLTRAILAIACSLAACSSGPAAVDALSDRTPAGEQRGDIAPDIDPTRPIVDLRADVNRNGTVDLADAGEDLDEEIWDAKHGAIFLANIDDDQNRCPKSGTDVSLAACHDAADEVVNGPDDELDLAPLRTVPWPGAPDDAVGAISVSAQAKPHVRLFKRHAGSYSVFNPETDTLSPAELRGGAELALEGKDVVRDSAVWDGHADVTFSVKVGSASPIGDTLRMRLAPLVTQHHLSAPRWVFATTIPGDPGSSAMLGDLTLAMNAAQIANTLVKLDIWDQWTQDLFEPSTMSMPAVGGPHVIYVLIRAASVENPKSVSNPLRQAGKVVFSLRGKDMAAVQQYDLKSDPEMGSLDSFGNTETIPPYTLSGTSYPLGRLFRGSTRSFHPDESMTKLLESQQVQPPVYIDTSWLLVGHVDETISFVRARTARGWALVVNDPAMAKQMLQKESAAGHGSTKMFVGKSWLDYGSGEYSATVSIDEVLADANVMGASALAAVEVDNQIAVIKAETGITDAEILYLPFLHWKVEGFALAYQVGTVNGVSLGDTHYAAADPHGPVIGGKDIFKAQMEEEMGKVGITVHWVEDWDLYHRLDGEIHCGCNIAREVSPSGPWWESGR